MALDYGIPNTPLVISVGTPLTLVAADNSRKNNLPYPLTIKAIPGAALCNIGVMAGSGPAALPVVVGLLWWWQWDNWTQDAVIDGQQGVLK